jgi:chromosome segregation ATPase
LKSLERDLNQLVRKNKSFDRKKEDAENERETLQEEARYQQEILNSERVVLSENPGTERETANEVLKDTEKEIKKARRAASRFDRKTRKNVQDQKNKIREIEKQQIKVEEVRNKLDNIR